MDNRKDLIMSLAGAMGVKKKQEDVTRYDRNTGTIYCGKKSYNTSEITDAKQFFENILKRIEGKNDASEGYYEIAVRALARIEKDILQGKMELSEKEGLSA